MLRDLTRDLRFFAALPFAIVADLFAGVVARIDTRYASALNPDEED